MNSRLYHQIFRKVLFEPLESRRVLTAVGLLSQTASEVALNMAVEIEPAILTTLGQHRDACGGLESNRETAAEGDGTAAGWDTGSTANITDVVTIQPIIVSNTDGSSTAGYFGDATQEAIIQDLIDEIWAQAGIDVEWLSPRYWNNTFVNFGSGTTSTSRPTNDLSTIVRAGDSAGVGNSDPLVLDMYFVEIAAGFPLLGPNYANGLAFVGGNGSTIHVGDDLLSFPNGRRVVARVVAHEIGHNLGLGHVSDPPNLMDDGELLNAAQISRALSSAYSVPLPANNAPTVANAISDVSVFVDAADTNISLANVFTDSDGDTLTYGISNNNTSLLSSSISGSNLILNYVAGQSGTATIEVTATDPRGASVTDQFLVTVNTGPSGSTDWGTVDIRNIHGVSATGSQWYQLTASRTGILSVAANFSTGSGDIHFELYDGSLNSVAASNGGAGSKRLDASVRNGEQFYLYLTGVNSNVDFSLVNAVTPNGQVVTVTGSVGDDLFSFQAGATHAITVNGLAYFFDGAIYNAFTFMGGLGTDTLNVTGLATTDTAIFHRTSLGMYGAGYGLNGMVEEIKVQGNGGRDIAHFYDSQFNDEFEAHADIAKMTYLSASGTALGFSRVYATSSSGGTDLASLFDSASDDAFFAQPGFAYMTGAGGAYLNQTAGFRQITAYANHGGRDTATLVDGATNDRLEARPSGARLAALTGEFSNEAIHFETVVAKAIAGGQDQAVFYDGLSNDEFIVLPGSAYLRSLSGEFFNLANGFEKNFAFATEGGTDAAVFFDTQGDDTFVATPQYAYLRASDVFSQASGFESFAGLSTSGGSDVAVLFDGPSDDFLLVAKGNIVLRGGGGLFLSQAIGFRSGHAIASEGVDHAEFRDSSGNDQYIARPGNIAMVYENHQFVSYASHFDTSEAFSLMGGTDTALLYDSSGDDEFQASPSSAVMRSLDGLYENRANQFDVVFGYSENGGLDRAILTDSPGNDFFVGTPGVSNLRNLGTFSNFATGFASVQAVSSAGGRDIANLYDSVGDDRLEAQGRSATLKGTGFSNQVTGFSTVSGSSEKGGVDRLDKRVVDFIFNAFGPWL